MKLSVRLSNAGMMSIIGLVVAVLLLTDISAHRERTMMVPSIQTSSGVTDKVVTKEFVLVDDNGTPRARIGMNDVNGPALQLFDKQGQQRAMLRLNKDDVPSLRLYDEASKLRSVTGFNLNTMEPQFILFDDNGNGRPVNNLGLDGISTFSSLYRDEDVAHNSQVEYTPAPSQESINLEVSGNTFRVINSNTDSGNR